MEDGTLICEGKGNPEWNYSAPHGAGRLMSRKKAKEAAVKKGLVEAAKKRMEEKGIYASALPADELRDAYKNCAAIEKAIGPTATIINRIKPIMAIKEGEGK
jgi:RNA-splicing ligase RtcB